MRRGLLFFGALPRRNPAGQRQKPRVPMQEAPACQKNSGIFSFYLVIERKKI